MSSTKNIVLRLKSSQKKWSGPNAIQASMLLKLRLKSH